MSVRFASMASLVCVLACAALLAGPGAMAQPSGPGPAESRAAGGEGPIRDGLRVPIPRDITEQRQREAGIGRPEELGERQLRELNELSRQLAPGVPVPAPDVNETRR